MTRRKRAATNAHQRRHCVAVAAAIRDARRQRDRATASSGNAGGGRGGRGGRALRWHTKQPQQRGGRHLPRLLPRRTMSKDHGPEVRRPHLHVRHRPRREADERRRRVGCGRGNGGHDWGRHPLVGRNGKKRQPAQPRHGREVVGVARTTTTAAIPTTPTTGRRARRGRITIRPPRVGRSMSVSHRSRRLRRPRGRGGWFKNKQLGERRRAADRDPRRRPHPRSGCARGGAERRGGAPLRRREGGVIRCQRRHHRGG